MKTTTTTTTTTKQAPSTGSLKPKTLLGGVAGAENIHLLGGRSDQWYRI
jgi:hypothetical protein